jgi:hypothetical protein
MQELPTNLPKSPAANGRDGDCLDDKTWLELPKLLRPSVSFEKFEKAAAVSAWRASRRIPGEGQ